MMKAWAIRLAGVVVLMATGQVWATTQYVSTQIPTPYGGLYNVMDLNNAGDVTYWGGGSYANTGYIWDGSTVTKLPGQGLYSRTIAYRLNDSGVAVGSIDFANNHQAAKWSDGALQVLDLGSLNSTDSVASAINNSGMIAGNTMVSGDGMHLFTISPDGVVSDQGRMPSVYQTVMDMNSSGQIIMMEPGPGMDGYLWRNGTYTPLPDLDGGNFGAPYGMNDAGLVVGMSWPHQTNAKAVCWQDGKIVRVLPVPDGTTGSCAFDVNDLGQIVGHYNTPSRGDRACLWDADGTFHDLGDLVVSGPTDWLTYAWCINDAGVIGISSYSSGHLLTPVPEPATLFIIMAGGLPVLLKRRRRRI